MNKKEHDEAVTSLKEICRYIGCSGLNPDMCNNRPHHCDIIRKLVKPSNNRVHVDAASAAHAEADSSLDIIPANVAGSHPRQ